MRLVIDGDAIAIEFRHARFPPPFIDYKSSQRINQTNGAAGWDTDPDAGLDEIGRIQADAMAEAMAQRARIEPDVAEIPSPIADLAARGARLRQIMPKRWAELDPWLGAWRDRVLAALASIETDSVVVSHFIAINAAVGHARGDDRMIVFRPDHCSRTVLDVTETGFRLVEQGVDGATRVL
jgi:broad specificity phosphatase PhoE